MFVSVDAEQNAKYFVFCDSLCVRQFCVIFCVETLTLLLTLCGLTSWKTHWGGLGLGVPVHEEAHPCFPYLVQPSFKYTTTV